MTRATIVIAILCTMFHAPLAGQGPGAGEGVRIGISTGGISTVALTVEFFRDDRSLDISIGTWSFRDLSLSATARQYFGASNVKPFAGAGLWLVAAPLTQRQEGTGMALILRAPIGLDWSLAKSHASGLVLNLNRGLWLKQSDPGDDLPMNGRLVPLPELYYRFTR